MTLVQAVRSLLLLSSLLGSQACADDVVRTQNGDVRGVTSRQVQSFKGIPYAAPPVGELRWMPPQEPANWSEILDASEFRSECPQRKPPQREFSGEEDCLYLNVFKPVSATNPLPVIVFIHGGSNVWGAASQTGVGDIHLYDGASLATLNVVVVTVNYRLGSLGFIAHPKLSEKSEYKRSGNYAYMDQNQALKWVQRNIAAFGGDPNNVTLFGQSAGAKGVWVHMTSPLSKGLFHRAIVHSAVREGARKPEDQEDNGRKLSAQLGCSNAGDAELACMRGKSAKEIVDALDNRPGTGLYAAVVDGKVLEAPPIAVMEAGQHQQVPVLQGTVAEEMSTLSMSACFVNVEGLTCPKAINNEDQYKDAVKKYAASIPGASDLELLRLYPGSDYRTFRKAYEAIRADREYTCPSRRVLIAISRNQTKFVGRFYYSHTYSSGESGSGPAHGYELPFIFNSLAAAGVKPTQGESDLVKAFQDAWVSFARTGTPPTFWGMYDRQKDNYVTFDTPMSGGEHLRKDQCDYWDKLPPL